MSVWSVEQVLALAPDAASQRAARSLATPRPWRDTGHDADTSALWGLCQGAGGKPYQAGVDLTGPAYRCSCPSRKIPCKHALGLLLLWSGGQVAGGEPPEWMHEWLAGRATRQAASAGRPARGPVSEQAVRRREGRVDGGLDELERWLADQIRQGLASASRAGYAHWDTMAARLVDAQAPGAASLVRRLAAVAGEPDRLLAELAMLRLLVRGYRRADELPDDLVATVRSRVGFPVAADDVLSSPPVRDGWQVIGVRDESFEERLTTRRVWLWGARTDRPALVLSFAGPGQTLPADLVLGTTVDADLCFYPGAFPVRALVATRYGPAEPAAPSLGESITASLDRYAAALARDPWLDQWPVLLRDVTPVYSGAWFLRDGDGAALPLGAGLPDPWPLVSFAGGGPVVVSAEWGARGLRPLAAWAGDRLVRL